MSTNVNNPDNGTDLPAWRQTGDRQWERVDGEVGLVRIHEQLPITSAAQFNRGERTEANRDLEVLVHDEELPSEPDVIFSGRDEAAALEAAREYMEDAA